MLLGSGGGGSGSRRRAEAPAPTARAGPHRCALRAQRSQGRGRREPPRHWPCRGRGARRRHERPSSGAPLDSAVAQSRRDPGLAPHGGSRLRGPLSHLRSLAAAAPRPCPGRPARSLCRACRLPGPALGAAARASRRDACRAAQAPDGGATGAVPHPPDGHRHIPRARARRGREVPTGPGAGREAQGCLPASVARRLASVAGAWAQAPLVTGAGWSGRRAGASALRKWSGV